ncbi:site-specific integrase [Pseudomonas moraviensis]|nr:site-specific integrase [Pseudomonas moraviensis]UST68628.1 site-specific integrase [Pseudomonas moraviensis]
MSYSNPQHTDRLILMPLARMAFESLPSRPLYDPNMAVVIADIRTSASDADVLHHYPFLFHSNGEPWHEANSYLLSFVIESNKIKARADSLRRLASRLLDYLLYCERYDLNWLDFTGRRPSLRPTYKYYNYLITLSGRSNQVINQYTSAIYHFYVYVSEHWHQIDMERVDTVKQVKFIVNGEQGGRVIDVLKRSQTMRSPGTSTVRLGFVRDEGEDLRPLTNYELSMLMKVVNNEAQWSAVERLILLCSLMTGARKQSVLTIRMKHLEEFCDANLLSSGAYPIYAGPRTGVDTKFDKPQVLHFPKTLADELTTLAHSPLMKGRRAKFMERMGKEHPGVRMDERDVYLFLSCQGNCYYMAEDDPRYALVKSPPSGQVAETLKRKILKHVPVEFPIDFCYHWLRATYAYQLYQRLQSLVRDGHLRFGDDISFIQARMHHESRQTTENYLKLFNMCQEKVLAQEIYESSFFKGSDFLAVEL